MIACNEKPSQNREALPYAITPNSDPHAIDQQGNPLQPINPLALHKSITFNEGSTNLSETAKEELEAANRANLPIVWKMLNQVEDDARVLAMEKEALVEDFMISYGEALSNIGFSTRDIMRMSAYGLTAV